MARTHGDAMIGFKSQADRELLGGNLGKAARGEPPPKRLRHVRFRAEQRPDKSAHRRKREAILRKYGIRRRSQQRRGEAGD
jgi:hypothetical protein